MCRAQRNVPSVFVDTIGRNMVLFADAWVPLVLHLSERTSPIRAFALEGIAARLFNDFSNVVRES